MKKVLGFLLISTLVTLASATTAFPQIGSYPPTFGRGPSRVYLDKESRKALENLRRVDKDDLLRHAQLLKGDNTGIFKLFPDNGCVAKNLIRVDGDCEGFVADSSNYHFRSETYGRGGGDIILFRNNFATKSTFSQPIIVSLGDVPIEDVTENNPAVRAVADYKPDLTPAGAERDSMALAHGIDTGGYRFAAAVSAATGPTYAFRLISFNVRGDVPKQKIRTRLGVYNVDGLKTSLKYQERKDTIYVFRVVRKDEDGGLTIVWKQLTRKDAPAIVFAKGDKIPKFFWRLVPSEGDK